MLFVVKFERGFEADDLESAHAELMEYLVDCVQDMNFNDFEFFTSTTLVQLTFALLHLLLRFEKVSRNICFCMVLKMTEKTHVVCILLIWLCPGAPEMIFWLEFCC